MQSPFRNESDYPRVCSLCGDAASRRAGTNIIAMPDTEDEPAPHADSFDSFDIYASRTRRFLNRLSPRILLVAFRPVGFTDEAVAATRTV